MHEHAECIILQGAQILTLKQDFTVFYMGYNITAGLLECNCIPQLFN